MTSERDLLRLRRVSLVKFVRCLFLLTAFSLLASFPHIILSQQPATNTRTTGGMLTISTEPNAIVWIDEIRRGVADGAGKLALAKVSAGSHKLRVRANGFRETTRTLLPGARSVKVKLLKSTDPAELLFQQAEEAREKAKDNDEREKAAELYHRALQLRGAFPAAHLGLARVLMDLNRYQDALSEIEAARNTRPNYPEASAVEGRIYREAAFDDKAIKSFRRAINESRRGFQPEAHVGLARVLEEKGQYTDAINEYRKAIDQLSDSEPIIYQLLGAAYERVQRPKEAVTAYEKYLELAPNGTLAPAIRSILNQLRREAAGEEIIP